MSKGLYFVLGAACGAAGAYFYLKNKFEQYAQEEINSVKETYKAEKEEKKHELVETDEELEEKVEIKHVKPDLKDLKKDMKDYARKSIKEYTDYSTKIEKPEDPVYQKFTEEPEIISEEDFGEADGYDTITLMYYSDGILAEDISDEIVEDAEGKVGTDYIDEINKDGVDVVYVRNDIEKTDYEILKNLQTYKEVTGNDPNPAETEE